MPLQWMETLIRQLKFAKKIKDYDVNSYAAYCNPDMENNVGVLFEQQRISWTTLTVNTSNQLVFKGFYFIQAWGLILIIKNWNT